MFTGGNKMEKFSFDFHQLDENLNKKAYKYNEVKHQLKKVAFDVVRFFDNVGIDGLWKIQKTKDGEVIVALYEDSKIEKSASVKNWSVITDSKKDNIFFSYKNAIISKIASSDLNIPKNEIDSFVDFLSTNLNLNENLQKTVLKNANTAAVSQFPELNGK